MNSNPIIKEISEDGKQTKTGNHNENEYTVKKSKNIMKTKNNLAKYDDSDNKCCKLSCNIFWVLNKFKKIYDIISLIFIS